MLTVYLLRHGETPWNAEGSRFCGRTDIPLSEKGKHQASAVRDQLAHIEFDAVYSSPLSRAYETARIASRDQKIVTDQRLIEGDFGLWEGKTKETLSAMDPGFYDAWVQDPTHTKSGGTGESGIDILNRVKAFFYDVCATHAEGTILVVGHNVVNRLYLADRLGMPLCNYRKIVQENAAVTLFTLDQHGDILLRVLNSAR